MPAVDSRRGLIRREADPQLESTARLLTGRLAEQKELKAVMSQKSSRVWAATIVSALLVAAPTPADEPSVAGSPKLQNPPAVVADPPNVESEESLPMEDSLLAKNPDGTIEEAIQDSFGQTDSCGCSEASLYGYGKPSWKIQVEGNTLSRTVDRKTLAVLRNRDDLIPFTRDLKNQNFDFAPGMKITLDKAIYDCTTFLEISYLSLPHWNENVTLSGLANDPVQFLQGYQPTNFGFNQNIVAQQIQYTSDFHDLELLIRTDLTRVPFNLSVFGGARYIHYNETFHLTEYASFPNNVFAQGDLVQSAINDMIGLEVGFDGSIPVGPYVKTGGLLKACLAADIMDAKTIQRSNTNLPNTILLEQVNTANFIKRASGIFEAGLYANVQLTRNLALKGGYHAIYLSGIAMAPLQQVPNSTNITMNVQVGGDVLLHGPFASIEWAWGRCN